MAAPAGTQGAALLVEGCPQSTGLLPEQCPQPEVLQARLLAATWCCYSLLLASGSAELDWRGRLCNGLACGRQLLAGLAFKALTCGGHGNCQ